MSEIFKKEIRRLQTIAAHLGSAQSLQEKIEVLNSEENVQKFLEKKSFIRTMLAGLSPECELIIKSVIAIGQDHVFKDEEADSAARVRMLIEHLLPVESFYQEIGGLVGYQLTMLEQLVKEPASVEEKYASPHPIDISHVNSGVRELVYRGIERMAELAEIYAVGGAADRLHLEDGSGKVLPAASLVFHKKTLLGWLVDDLSAREYLYYKIFHQQLITPLALMTSLEKGNHGEILKILEENNWFLRGKENYRLFCQPVVPTIDKEGKWCTKGAMNLLLRPGGHGVIWKLAEEEGVMKWFSSQGRNKALVRQINNPVAGVDYGLLAFTGYGLANDKKFGFASCDHRRGSAEGMDIVIQKTDGKGHHYVVTNVEYCDEKRYKKIEEDLGFDKLYANTNILFADLSAVLKALQKCFIPGMIMNMKPCMFESEAGEKKEQMIGRLESTMQNIADYLGDTFQGLLSKQELTKLSTFITFNRREKTISTIKKPYVKGAPLAETPEGCMQDLLNNASELLAEYCHVKAPSAMFFYHPSLGPIYEVIGQKIRGGSIASGSYLDLEIAELDMQGLELDGALLITAADPMGKVGVDGVRTYSENSGKCSLKNVRVRNLGVDAAQTKSIWKKSLLHKEACEIVIKGNGEFYAEDVLLEGGMRIDVEDGFKVTAFEKDGKIHFKQEKIISPSWYWEYRAGQDGKIVLQKKELS